MQKVLIIKLGYSETIDSEISRTTSLGDVLRTTVILEHFKDDDVTWLVDEKAFPLLDKNPYIRRILIFDPINILQLQKERFDTVINFEKVPGICALADSVSAWRRFGFRFDGQTGEAQAHDGCEQVFSLAHNLDKKRMHRISWQKQLLEMVGAEWKGQNYVLGYKPDTTEQFDVGLNYQVGSKWPNKAWARENWEKLAEILQKNNFSVSWQEGLSDLYQYMDWLNKCRVIISSDSLGFHIALALKKGTVVLFGPTNSFETDMYGRGAGIYPRGFDCVPCLKNTCDKNIKCIDTIKPEEVFIEFRKLFNDMYGKAAVSANYNIPAEKILTDPRIYNQPKIVLDNFLYQQEIGKSEAPGFVAENNLDLNAEKIELSQFLLPEIRKENSSLPLITIPDNYNYFGAWLTFACPLSCSYCINRQSPYNLKAGHLTGEEWVRGINRVVSRPDLPVTLSGGEPTLHQDFYYIVNNIKPDLNIDLLTNLEFNIDEFIANVSPDRIKRNAPYASIRVSYHPETMSLDRTIEKVLTLLGYGYSIGIWSVLHPKYVQDILEAQKKCTSLGIDFRVKEFLGWHENKLYGHYKYEEAITRQKAQKVLCKTTEFLIGPAGNIHRCSGDLFASRSPIGHILDLDFKIEEKFRGCEYFGYCNPCDVKVKTNRFQQYGHTSVEIRPFSENSNG